MIEEELPDELENDLDDIEPVGDESQLYEHFRVVVDKGQTMVRVDKYLYHPSHFPIHQDVLPLSCESVSVVYQLKPTIILCG